MGGVSSASGGDTGGVVAVSGTTATTGGRMDGGTTSAGGQSGEDGGAGLGGESTTSGGAAGSSDAGGRGSTGKRRPRRSRRALGRASERGGVDPVCLVWNRLYREVLRHWYFGDPHERRGVPVSDCGRRCSRRCIPGEARRDGLSAAAGLTPGEHVVELYRQTEGRYGDSELKKIEVIDGELLDPPPGPDAVLEVIGDSITCGYGNLGADASCSFSFATESHWDSYGAVAGRVLGIDVHTIAISGHGLTRNNDGTTTDLLPDVSSAHPHARTIAALAILRSAEGDRANLGTNDFAKGNPGTDFEDQYRNFLARLRDLHPDAFLLATLGPMMNGTNLNNARAYIQNAVLAFEADGKVGFLEYSGQVTGELGCNSHPNVAKHEQMADALVAKISALNLY